jgi:translation initiation factor 3 subunit L
MVHIVESTIGRRYGSLFIRNTEYAQRIFDNLRNSPLPIHKAASPTAAEVPTTPIAVAPKAAKVTWAKT